MNALRTKPKPFGQQPATRPPSRGAADDMKRVWRTQQAGAKPNTSYFPALLLSVQSCSSKFFLRIGSTPSTVGSKSRHACSCQTDNPGVQDDNKTPSSGRDRYPRKNTSNLRYFGMPPTESESNPLIHQRRESPPTAEGRRDGG